MDSPKSNYTLFGHSDAVTFFCEDSEAVTCLDFFTRGDKQYLVSGSEDGFVRVRQTLPSEKILHYIYKVYTHNIANNPSCLILSSQIWDLEIRACVHTTELISPVRSVKSLPDRAYLLIGFQDCTVHLWSSARFR